MQIDTTHQSPNFDDRPEGEVVDAIVLHSSEGTKASDLGWLCNPASQVSSHYYVDRAGLVYQLVDPHKRAWHAGASFYAGRTGWNDFSIGIEAEHKIGQDWPNAQCAALADLCRSLIGQFPIRQSFIVAHRWIAPARKIDPTDWPDTRLHAWIVGLFVRTYRTKGLPVYQQQSGAGPLCGHLQSGEQVEIDKTYPNGFGHLADGRGFVCLDGLDAI